MGIRDLLAPYYGIAVVDQTEEDRVAGVIQYEVSHTPSPFRPNLDVRIGKGLPENTALCGNQIMINIGGASPPWVLKLLETEEGTEALQIFLRSLTEEESQ